MSMDNFKIETANLNSEITIVRVAGYLDAHTFEEFEETVNQLFNEETYKLIVDLSKVEYISSAGAGVFIGALSTAQDHDGNIVLMNPTPNVREVFDLLGLSQIFQIAENQEGALASF